MARGYKAPANYDPHRAPKQSKMSKQPKRKQRPGAPGQQQTQASKQAQPSKQQAGKQQPRPAHPGRRQQDARAEQRGTSRTPAAAAARIQRGSAPAVKPGENPAANHYASPKRIPTDRVYPPLPAQLIHADEAHGITFTDLGLGSRIIRELAKQGAETPYPLQVATIPDALAGRNVLGRGRTGSGKTIAFGAALVERLFLLRGGRAHGAGRPPQALVLAPTRELALQIDRTIQPFARALGFYTTQLYGGVPASKQREGLKRGVDIVIGTPGRIDDLAARGALDLSQVVITVLDEADIMAEMGFIEDVNRILHRTRSTGQRLLFSATLDGQVRGLVERYLPDPAVHEVADDRAAISHRIQLVPRGGKEATAARLVASGGRVLVFVRTRAGADALVASLASAGVTALPLHGDVSQQERVANLSRFSTGRVDVLVATDVAARGIHVDGVTLVLQFDPPFDHKTYVHRAGRTGRAEATGTVVTFATAAQLAPLQELLARAGIDAELE